MKSVVIAMVASAVSGCLPETYREVEVDLGEVEGQQGMEPRVAPARRFRFSVAAMQSPESTYESYTKIFDRVGHLLGVDIELVQRRTYREVNDLLVDGQLDAALLCTGGYLALRRGSPERVEVIAVPVVGGKTTYESLVVVPAASDARSVEDLAGKRFAFTDELSLSGRLYPVHLLRGMRRDPATFFGSTLYTRSHDRSIEALARGLADGAAVDSLIYDGRRATDPGLVGKTRVIHRSPPLGMMPVVVSAAVSRTTRTRLQEALVGLDRDPEAGPLLRAIHIERFVVPPAGLYDQAAMIVEEAL
jgi:phosphonate transport system substrate-binding protein